MAQVPQRSPIGADPEFGARLRQVREAAGLTQRVVAEQMTVRGFRMDNTAVARIERGQRAVYLAEAVELAQMLGVPLPTLTGVGLTGGEIEQLARIHRMLRLIDDLEAAEAEVARLQRAIAKAEAEIDRNEI